MNFVQKAMEAISDVVNTAGKMVNPGVLIDIGLKYIGSVIIDIINEYTELIMNGLLAVIKGLLTSIAKDGWFITETKEILEITKPIAISIVALIFVIEFGKRVVYLETMTTEGVAKPILMLIVGKILVDKCDVILKGILEVSNLITTSIVGSKEDALLEVIFTKTKVSEASSTTEILFNAVTHLGITVTMLICMIIIIIILSVRGIEIALLICVSPMVFATVVGNVTNDIFKNFIKYFTAVCMQTIIIAICIKFVSAMSKGNLIKGDFDTKVDAPIKAIITTLMAVLLTLFVVQSKKMMLNLLNAKG